MKIFGEPALREPQKMKEEYKQRVKDRIVYFSKNIGYAFDFYIKKIASMWTENTYAAVRSNTVSYFSFENMIKPLTFYQKVLLVIIAFVSIFTLIQNRNNLSLDVLFLITIFAG